jgi:hypothetical protein
MSNRRIGKGGPAKHLLIFGFLLTASVILTGRANAGTITVAWDPVAEAGNVTGYRVHVGTTSNVYTQTFDVPADESFFVFRNAFMGVRYYFAVSAQFDGSTFGPRSSEVTAVGTRTVGGGLPGGVRVTEPAPVWDCGADCFVVTDIARGLGEISSLAVATDGTVFAVEAGRRVVVLRGGAAVAAYEAEPGTVLRDIALDARYESTGRVFLSLVRPRNRLAGDVEVLRLRHLAGTLGEPSTIVAGPSLPLGAALPLTIGDDGVVYLALPAMLSRDPYSAAVLAYDQDGRVPDGRSSPVVARGVDEPVDLAWDAQAGTLWLIGRTGGSEVQLLSIPRGAENGVLASRVVAAGEHATAVAVVSGAARRLLVSAGVDLIEAAPGTADSLRISLEGYGAPVAVAAGGGARYVATRIDGAIDAYGVVKVEDGVLAR